MLSFQIVPRIVTQTGVDVSENPRALWRLAEDDEMWRRRSGEDIVVGSGGTENSSCSSKSCGMNLMFQPSDNPTFLQKLLLQVENVSVESCLASHRVKPLVSS